MVRHECCSVMRTLAQHTLWCGWVCAQSWQAGELMRSHNPIIRLCPTRPYPATCLWDWVSFRLATSGRGRTHTSTTTTTHNSSTRSVKAGMAQAAAWGAMVLWGLCQRMLCSGDERIFRIWRTRARQDLPLRPTSKRSVVGWEEGALVLLSRGIAWLCKQRV